MLILNNKENEHTENTGIPEDSPPSFEDAVAGPSSQSSPRTGTSVAQGPSQGAINKLIDVNGPTTPGTRPNGEALDMSSPPPEFTPFNAEFEVQNGGDIISHDPHLNDDGMCVF